MVFIENRYSYFQQRVNETPKLKTFYQFLLDKEVDALSNNVTDIDKQFLKILSSIQKNDKSAFGEIHSDRSRSTPGKGSQSPFINDDYLIFAFIVGITKFKIDKTWIKSIISIRSRNPITITFENILNENYLSTDNQPEIILVFLNLCNQLLIDNALLNKTYRSITENTTLFENRNDFQILCAIKAYDLIIELKEVSDGNEITLLKEFNKTFKKRIEILSWITQAGVFLCVFYVLVELSNYFPGIAEFFDKNDGVFTILGISGFTVLGNVIPFIKNKWHELLMRLFGYPKGLIQKTEKK